MFKVKFYGVGGQGIVTAAKVLSIAVSLYEEKYAATVPAYGHERRGAPVYADVLIDEKQIRSNCFVYEPDMVVIADDSLIDKGVDPGKGAEDGCMFLLSTGSSERLAKHKDLFGYGQMFCLDAGAIARNTIGLDIPNSAILGAIAGVGVVSIEAIEQAIRQHFGEKAGEKNVKAAREAYQAVRKT